MLVSLPVGPGNVAVGADHPLLHLHRHHVPSVSAHSLLLAFKVGRLWFVFLALMPPQTVRQARLLRRACLAQC